MTRLWTLSLVLVWCLGACGDDATGVDGGADTESIVDSSTPLGDAADAQGGPPVAPLSDSADDPQAVGADTSETEVMTDAGVQSDSTPTPDASASPDTVISADASSSDDVLSDAGSAVDVPLSTDSSMAADGESPGDAGPSVDVGLSADTESSSDGELGGDTESSVDGELGVDGESSTESDSVASSCTPSGGPKPSLVDVELTDYCAASPCANGATCENHARAYTCHCAPGFYGVDCALSGGDPSVQWSIQRYGLGGATYMPSLRMDRLGYLHLAWSGQALEASANGAYATNQGAAISNWRRTFEGALVYPIVATDALAFAHASGRTAAQWYGHVSNNPLGVFNGNLDAHSHEQRIEVGTNYKVRYFTESDSGQQAISGSNVYLKLLNKPVIPKELLAEGVCQNGAGAGSACWESSECEGGFCSQSAGFCPSDGSACGHAASTCGDEMCLYNDKLDAYWTAMTEGDDLHFVIGLYAIGETEQHIFYTQKLKGESQWSYPLKIEATASGATTPSLALDGEENLHVAFDGHDGLIYYLHNVEGAWSEPVAIESTSEVNEHLPSLAVAENGSAHVVWVKEDVPGGGEQGLLLEYAHNSGGTWSEPIPVARVTGNIGTQWGHNVERIGLSPQSGKAYVIFGSESQGPFPGEDMFLAYTSSVDIAAALSEDASVTQVEGSSPPESLELCWEEVEVARFEVTDAGADGLDTIVERLYFFAGAEQPLGHLNEGAVGLASMLSAAHLYVDDEPAIEGSVVDNRIMFGALNEELLRVDDGTMKTLTLKLSTHPTWPEAPALHLMFAPAHDVVTMGGSSHVERDAQHFEIGPIY